MRIGCDVDGVVADFNSLFTQRCIDVTGKDLFPPRPFNIPTWDYPQFYGYSQKETQDVWVSIKADRWFWTNLGDYPTTLGDLFELRSRQHTADDVYFITNRMGERPKDQTEEWFSYHDFARCTVLLSAAKGLCAEALQLTHYIDDKFENCLDVVKHAPDCKVSIMDRPWNRTQDMVDALTSAGVVRVQSVREILVLA